MLFAEAKANASVPDGSQGKQIYTVEGSTKQCALQTYSSRRPIELVPQTSCSWQSGTCRKELEFLPDANREEDQRQHRNHVVADHWAHVNIHLDRQPHSEHPQAKVVASQVSSMFRAIDRNLFKSDAVKKAGSQLQSSYGRMHPQHNIGTRSA
jgi:hypothetical protein